MTATPQGHPVRDHEQGRCVHGGADGSRAARGRLPGERAAREGEKGQAVRVHRSRGQRRSTVRLPSRRGQGPQEAHREPSSAAGDLRANGRMHGVRTASPSPGTPCCAGSRSGAAAIDAATFSTVRLAAGAATLLLITTLAKTGAGGVGGSWLSATLLFLYAIPFSFAYLSLSAGTGALILFGSVQLTMMLAALGSGERPHASAMGGARRWHSAGLVYLVLPGLAAPSAVGAALMALAGVSWGVYSLRGRRSAESACANHRQLRASRCRSPSWSA